MAKFDSQYPEQVSPEEGDKFLIASEQDGEIMSLQFGTVIKSIEKQLNQVDDKLSTTSLKPVQNKVITMAINEIQTELQSAAKEATLESVQSLVNQVYNEGAKQGTLTETALQIRQGFDKTLSKEEVILLYLKALGTDVRGIIRGREQIYIPTDETVEESGSIRYRILRIDGEVYWSDALDTSGVIYNSPTSQEEIDRIMQYYPSIRKIDSVIRALQLNVEELSDSARSYKNEIIHAIEEAVTPVIKTLPHYVYDEGILRLPYSEAMSYVDVTDYVNQILKLGFKDRVVHLIENCGQEYDTFVFLRKHYINEEDGTNEVYYQKINVLELLNYQPGIDLTVEWEGFIENWDGKGFIYVELDFGMLYYSLEYINGEQLFENENTPSSVYYDMRYPVDMEKLSAFPEIGYRNECDILTQNEV